MADTQPLAPTDAELDELRQANSGRLNFVTFSEFRTIARAALAKWGALPVPAWYALVPVEPTPEMVDAAQEAYMPFGDMQLAIQLAIAAAPQPVAREPLTDEQLWANDEIMSLNADLGWHMETIRMFARAIERAHGIKGGQHG